MGMVRERWEERGVGRGSGERDLKVRKREKGKGKGRMGRGGVNEPACFGDVWRMGRKGERVGVRYESSQNRLIIREFRSGITLFVYIPGIFR